MFSDYRNCTEFYNAIQKHGAEVFEGKIVAEFFSLEEAEEMEKKLIAEFRTQEEAFGYNLRSGGRNGKHSEKTKERIGKANKRMAISKEHKEQISRANSLKVVCLQNKDGMTILFDSVKHAGKITGVHPSTISKACKGVNKTAGGCILMNIRIILTSIKSILLIIWYKKVEWFREKYYINYK